jgi:hypothetical protein
VQFKSCLEKPFTYTCIKALFKRRILSKLKSSKVWYLLYFLFSRKQDVIFY